jgi:hypothetical protein
MMVGAAAAQGVPGRIVQASDGTLYLLKDGARYAIVTEPIGDEELDAYADGGAVDAAQLPNALAPAAPTVPAAAVEMPGAVVPRAERAAAAPPAEPGATVPGARKTDATGTGAPPAAPRAPATPYFVTVQGANPGRTASVTVQTAAGGSCALTFLAPGPRRGAGVLCRVRRGRPPRSWSSGRPALR